MIRSNDHPVVSVCIQTYQHADYIKECLDSALSQETDFPFEIILGEDDSTDGARDICIQYAEKHPDIIHLYLRSEKDKIYINGEKTGRFNFLENLKAATGKYIALIDGDDYWCDNRKLQKQVEYMEANPDCSMSFHKTLRCYKKGRAIENKKALLPDVNTKFSIDYFLKCNPVNTVSCMFLRNNADDIPSWFYELPFLDYALHVHNAQKGKIGFMPEAMAVYRTHPGGMWNSRRAPDNDIKRWRLYSIMSVNLAEEEGRAILLQRHKVGMDLVHFYKNNLWKNGDWFQKELEQKKFPGDEKLLKAFNSLPGIKNYFFNCKNYTKAMARKVIKGS